MGSFTLHERVKDGIVEGTVTAQGGASESSKERMAGPKETDGYLCCLSAYQRASWLPGSLR